MHSAAKRHRRTDHLGPSLKTVVSVMTANVGMAASISQSTARAGKPTAEPAEHCLPAKSILESDGENIASASPYLS